MTRFQIFIIRAILGIAMAVALTHFFYPNANKLYVAGIGIILVGLSYFSEYLRHKK
ncbi:MAG: hypothetical protein J7K84_10185 [Deltaproteobacteria bacterium]|nr:hypothetical protein [Deltaproteobacteria bacterium]